MLFSRDMAAAFGDWLERERIHDALTHARPELRDRLELDAERPLLRIRTPGGAGILVARTTDGQDLGWVVGVPHPHTPTVHEPRSREELVEHVLEVLDAVGPREGGAPAPH